MVVEDRLGRAQVLCGAEAAVGHRGLKDLASRDHVGRHMDSSSSERSMSSDE